MLECVRRAYRINGVLERACCEAPILIKVAVGRVTSVTLATASLAHPGSIGKCSLQNRFKVQGSFNRDSGWGSGCFVRIRCRRRSESACPNSR
eukprot:2891218-Alexandrium_andersonii.AAC.2